MSRVGPTRLLAINAGKYDYADVALDLPLHLVGPNNVGKTSLIAMLQFLFIDDQREMHFSSRTLAETRRYYFPDPYSYVLFECRTPTGYQVLGLHGMGPIQQHQFTRFAYSGLLLPEDYLDAEQRPRSWEDVRHQLAARDFRTLEPIELRSALTGQGEVKGAALGLVPLKNRGYYDRFRTVFKQLLRLSHLKQEELKELLLDVHHGDFQQRQVNLQGVYAEQLQGFDSARRELAELQRCVPEIRQLLHHAGKRQALRAVLPGLWRRVQAAFEADTEELAQKIAEHGATITRITAEHTVASAAHGELQNQQRERYGKRVLLLDKLKEVEEEGTHWRDWVQELATAQRNELQARHNALVVQVGRADFEPREQVERRLAQTKRDLYLLRQQLAGISRSVARWAHGHYTDEELDSLFRLLNPAILGLQIGQDGVQLHDEEQASAAIRQLQAQIHDTTFASNGMELALGKLRGPDLAAYTDPATMQVRIQELERQQNHDQGILAAILAAEPMRRQIAELLQALDSMVRKQTNYDRYLAQTQQVPGWQADAARLKTEETALGQQLSASMTHLQKLDECRKDAASRQEHDQLHVQRLAARRSALKAPPSDWPVVEVPATSMIDVAPFLALAEEYQRQYVEEGREHDRVEEIMGNVARITLDRYRQNDDAATFEELRQQLEALPAREKALQERWQSLTVGLRSDFKALRQDLEKLKSAVSDINRRLGKVDISNLEALSIQVIPQPRWLAQIAALVDAEEQPLFADAAVAERAIKELGELLKLKSEVKLADLFDLQFELKMPSGETKKYPNLDRIESNGTTITIKVLINLILLEELLVDDHGAIPFYLDEASSLDHANLAAIVAYAFGRGFVPVLASPDAMQAAQSLYFIKEERGRVQLGPQNRILIQPLEALAAAASTPELEPNAS